ncbi:hypothetical protein LCGC14_2575060 [marine sediment metagenome]|uniref:HEAT repeat domain-containing protein n=1 Tax=marine sediment metagenome TaxID=412755 RepID=A0A0F9D8V7_9ZZZZ
MKKRTIRKATIEKGLSRKQRRNARKLRSIIADRDDDPDRRASALVCYLGAIMPEAAVRQQQIIANRCLFDPDNGMRFTAAAALSDGWIEPNAAIVDCMRMLADDPYSPIQGCVAKFLEEHR